MAANGGRHRLGPDDGQLLLRTYRSGLAAQAGHDLTIEMTRWSGDLDPGEGADFSKASLEVRIDMGALAVREGRGGVKPLTDRDRREIAVTGRKQIEADRFPEATFVAGGFEPDGSGGGAISGSLTLHGQSRPLRLQVTRIGEDKYRVTASIVQSEYGIRPYSGMFGALKLRDNVDVEAEVDLSRAPSDPGVQQ